MGYTHSWYRQKVITASIWVKLKADVEKLIAAFPDRVVRDYDQSELPPEVSGQLIAFNGPERSGHETFRFPRIRNPRRPGEHPKENGLWFDFCKTEHKPYDLLVTASLLTLKSYLGDSIKVWTDGRDGEWIHRATGAGGLPGAIPYCERVLGRGFGLTVSDDGELIAGPNASREAATKAPLQAS